MIDPTLRRLRIAQEAGDPESAELLLDVVLGYGSASDPGGALAGAIRGAVGGRKNGGGLVAMAHICGTGTDPQSYKEQSDSLTSAGTHLFSSNALMASAAALMAGGDAASARLKAKWGELLG